MQYKMMVSAIALIAAAQASAQETRIVTNPADAGDGSLRAALADLAATGGTVVIATEGDIIAGAGFVYEGTAPLTIIGAGQTIRMGVNETVLAMRNGADLTMSDLSLVGPGGFDITARGDVDGPAGKGLFVDVRDDQTGVVALDLTNVSVRDVAGHGIHISDCTLADECGGGGGGAGEGSSASISVRLSDVIVDRVGYGRFDADGLRVDERGAGDIHFTANGSIFSRVGADGVELDEGQDGSVVLRVSSSVFNNNGGYCDPVMLSAFPPAEPEGEFAEGVMAANAIPGAITGSPDDRCFEREVDLYDDGSVEAYEFAIDVDDGFDIDEAGAGDIRGTISGSVIARNLDEGLDFDEEGPGGIHLMALSTIARGNTDDGFKSSEEDAGDVMGLMINAVARDNGGVGIVFEEEDAGDVRVEMRGGATSGNDDGDTSLEIVQEDDGAGALILIEAGLEEDIEVEGVTVTR